MWIQVAVSVPRLWHSNKWLAWEGGGGGGARPGELGMGSPPAVPPPPPTVPRGSLLWSRPVGKSYFKALCYF